MMPLAARSAFKRTVLLSKSSLRYCNRHQNVIMPTCHRPFSKYEIDVQDASKPSLQTPTVGSTPPKSKPTLSPSQKRSVEEIAEQLIIAEHKSQLELQDAHGLLLRTCAEAQAILANNETSSSEEIVATADYVLILMNDDELDISIAKIQDLQRELDEQQSDQRVTNLLAHDGELSRAVEAMNKLHRIFLTMVDICIPPISSSAQNTDDQDGNHSIPDEIWYDKERFSAKTVARGMQIARRAEDLGMPLHRPLYRRLAMSVVLTSFPQLNDDKDTATDAVTPLVLPGQLQQRKEGFHPPIATELVDLCIRARSALKIPSPIFSIERDPLEVFAAEILSKPLLLLLKQKQWEEAMGLLQGWREHFGRSEKIHLLDMLGEDATLDALEIAKSWVVDDEFGKDAQACRHALELTNLLQDSLEQLLDERKSLRRILPNIIYQLDSPSDAEEFDSDASDSEFEEEFDSDDDDDDWAQSSARKSDTSFISAHDSITMDYAAEDSAAEHQIIAGMSNEDARMRIYLRNGGDWSLPDVVDQLEEWNKGKPLSFSPAFERYLGQQMTEDEEEYYD
mmetsp:Transcript_11296/g.18677  ORF Transcript_11296/g.18677 Transcript_11296/m.18677 type:complete len:566 (+) Transcript_11296:222-1919(+)